MLTATVPGGPLCWTRITQIATKFQTACGDYSTMVSIREANWSVRRR